MHNDDLVVVEDSGDEGNDEDGHSLSDNDFLNDIEYLY